MLRTSDLDYSLPADLIATRPADPRDAARLLVLSRADPSVRTDAHVRDLPSILRAGDVLITNVSSVLPARLEGRRASGGKIDGLFLAELSRDDAGTVWAVMLRSGRKLAAGERIDLVRAAAPDGPPASALTLIERAGDHWRARIEGPLGAAPTPQILGTIGATPLPPYILAARRAHDDRIADAQDRAWYQTVYARPSAPGSIAAPTAGLHFTPALLDALRARGVSRAEVTLHVGAGTFKPVEAEHVEEHPMHEEWRQVPRQTLDAIDSARAAGGRAIAIGTTSARAVESLQSDRPLTDAELSGSTRLLISPGHRWARLDGLLTNFHLPRSTLLALVASLLEPEPPRPDHAAGEGVRRLLAAYQHAIRERYRFYSYGDAMLILP